MVRTVAAAAAWLAAVLTAPALTVATFNLENYTLADRMVDGVFRQAYPKPEAEQAALIRVVAGIAPDILAVQEMGGPPYLEEFRRALERAGQDFPFAVVLEGPDPDRHVAVLAKLPFREVRRHARVPVTYFGREEAVKRGVLEVSFATAAGDLTLFVVHLKSKRTERPDDPEGAILRAREAEAVRDLVLTRHPDPRRARFIVCGDWNDTPNTRPVRALQKRGETVVGEILRATDSRGETWTQFYRAAELYSRFDYLLVSPALRPHVAGGRALIWDGDGSGAGSDHRPVYLRLEFAAGAP